MALSAERIKAIASWGVIGGGTSRIIEGPIEIIVSTPALLEVTLEADEIIVEIDNG